MGYSDIVQSVVAGTWADKKVIKPVGDEKAVSPSKGCFDLFSFGIGLCYLFMIASNSYNGSDLSTSLPLDNLVFATR